jgi:hypothetical protein
MPKLRTRTSEEGHADPFVRTPSTTSPKRLVAGQECAIRGERGRFRFLAEVTNPRTGETWVDVYGPAGHAPALRSFDPARITRAFRMPK